MAIITVLVAIGICGCRTPQQREAEFLRRGKIEAAKKDYARAALDFRNAVQAAPADAEAHYQLGLMYLSSTAPAQAYAEFKRAAELDPRHSGAVVQLAQLVAAGGNRESLEAAHDKLDRLLHNLNSNADALTALAMIDFRLGKPDAAAEILARAIRSFPNDVRSAAALAKLEVSRGQFSKAEEALRNLVTGSPHSFEAKLALADFYLSQRQWSSAEEQFRNAVHLESRNELALVGLAAAEAQLGHAKEAERIYRQISFLPDPQYRDIYAKYLLIQQRYADAVNEFARLSKAEPDDRRIRDNLVIACLLDSQDSKASAVLAKALAANPKDVNALLLSGVVLLKSARYDAAEQKLDQVVSSGGNIGMARFLLSRVYRSRGQLLQQRQELTEALRINPDLLEARLDLARNLLAANAPKTALDILNAAAGPQRTEMSWIVLRNWSLMFAGESQQFGKAVDAALQIERSPDLLLQSALAKMLARNYHDARAQLDEALRIAPEDTRLLRVMAQSYAAERQPSIAARFLAEYAARWPKSAAVRIVQGEWLAKTGDYEGARQAFLAAGSLDQHALPEAELQLAMLDAGKNRFDEARSLFVKCLERDPYRLSARLWLANIEDRTHEYQAAIKDYRQVLQIDGENVVALNNLAYLLATQTDHTDEALTLAQKASELSPGSADVEGTLGWVLYRKGLYDNAVRLLEDASQKDAAAKTDGATLRKYHLGMAYLKTGNRPQALKLLATAIGANRDLPEAEAVQQLLARNGAR